MDIKTASAVRRLRLVSAVEAVSYLLLLVCSVLKRTTEFNAVPVMGAVHGVLVLLFLVFLADAWNRTKWQAKRPLILFVLSLIPFGGFYAEKMLREEEREQVVAAHARKAAAAAA
ncbi:DUF3817 domain-containing protein [Streptomyces sp. A3M-1-3]|uniref:DUF3817 domain-containing protein n=1 Tax=Streptomyces sp. A3M-1-3 TaxID=2962044 RepID=UPI0020B6AFDD|nr:DUF3817 domain-containing protein [Streptomyces sp. A3M-1-3]MCP3816896.1 DUF3817 domain-containing protein [Streptomyces sp. A3M-1-3]